MSMIGAFVKSNSFAGRMDLMLSLLDEYYGIVRGEE